jgi:hypothetical protein
MSKKVVFIVISLVLRRHSSRNASTGLTLSALSAGKSPAMHPAYSSPGNLTKLKGILLITF